MEPKDFYCLTCGESLGDSPSEQMRHESLGHNVIADEELAEWDRWCNAQRTDDIETTKVDEHIPDAYCINCGIYVYRDSREQHKGHKLYNNQGSEFYGEVKAMCRCWCIKCKMPVNERTEGLHPNHGLLFNKPFKSPPRTVEEVLKEIS